MINSIGYIYLMRILLSSIFRSSIPYPSNSQANIRAELSFVTRNGSCEIAHTWEIHYQIKLTRWIHMIFFHHHSLNQTFLSPQRKFISNPRSPLPPSLPIRVSCTPLSNKAYSLKMTGRLGFFKIMASGV